MNKIVKFGTFICILILLGSCKDDVIGDTVNIDIKEEFKVLLWEQLEENNRSFQLNLETIAQNSCEDAQIEFSQFSQSSEIYVTVKDIVNDHCTLGEYPAKANVLLGDLTDTEYDLEVNLKNVIPNKGKLLINNDYYEIKMETLNGITIPNTRLYKVPENTIWGYAAYEDDPGELVANSFIGELDNITSSIQAPAGYYGYFNLESGSFTLNNFAPQGYSKTFIFSYSQSPTELVDILNSYRIQNPDLEFKIFTSKGESL